MKIGSLFSGYGGLDLAVEATFGATTAWVSDIDKGACKVLAHRFPDAPNLGDLTKIDWTTVEPVDIITGGFPCQDLSHAGRRVGMTSESRSGLWSYMCDAIEKLQPRLVVAENVRGLLSAEALRPVEPCTWCVGDEPVVNVRALGAVLADLADIGYDAGWYGLPAADAGACHRRFRVFLGAYPRGEARVEWARLRKDESARDGQGLAPRGGWQTDPAVTLLPTPNPFHAGNTESPEEWRKRRLDVFQRTGTRHGPALSVVALSIAEGNPLTPDRYMPDELGDTSCPAPAPPKDSDLRSAENLPTTSSKCTSKQGSVSTDGLLAGSSSKPSTDPSKKTAPDRLLPTPTRRDWKDGPRVDAVPENALLGRTVWNLEHDFGAFTAAVQRWEIISGRTAPAPTEPTGRNNAHRLAPSFVEWMMGLPEGWVTNVPGMSRNEALKALGNGVVPQQAEAALAVLLDAIEGLE